MPTKENQSNIARYRLWRNRLSGWRTG